MPGILFRVCLSGKIKKMSIKSPSLIELKKKIIESFDNVEENSIEIEYNNDDDEAVKITNDEDLIEATRELEEGYRLAINVGCKFKDNVPPPTTTEIQETTPSFIETIPHLPSTSESLIATGSGDNVIVQIDELLPISKEILDIIDKFPSYHKLKDHSINGMTELNEAISNDAQYTWLSNTFSLAMGDEIALSGSRIVSKDVNKEKKITSPMRRPSFALSFRFSLSGESEMSDLTNQNKLSEDVLENYRRTSFIFGEHDNGAITDLVIVVKGEPLPEGYSLVDKVKIDSNPAEFKMNNKFVNLAYKRSMDSQPITSIAIIYPDKGGCSPPGFEAVKSFPPITFTSSHNLHNISADLKNQVILAIRKGLGPPITEIKLMFKGDNLPGGFICISKSTTGDGAELNPSSSNTCQIVFRSDIHYFSRLSGGGGNRRIEESFSPALFSPPLSPSLITTTSSLFSSTATTTTISSTIIKSYESSHDVVSIGSLETVLEGEVLEVKERIKEYQYELDEGLGVKDDLSKLDLEAKKVIDRMKVNIHDEISAAYNRYVFPFLAVMQCNNDILTCIAIKYLKIFIKDRVFDTNPKSYGVESKTRDSEYNLIDVIITCLTTLPASLSPSAYQDVCDLLTIIFIEGRGGNTNDKMLLPFSCHLIFSFLSSSVEYFLERKEIINNKVNKEIEASKNNDRHINDIKNNQMCLDSSQVCLNNFITIMMKYHKGIKCESEFDISQGDGGGLSAAKSIIDICLSRVKIVAFTSELLKTFLKYKKLSYKFAVEIIALGSGNFSMMEDVSIFVLLMDIVKGLYEPLPKGVAIIPQKIIDQRETSLELLLSALNSSSDKFREDPRWTYITRKFICPSIFGSFNGAYPNIFKLILDIIAVILKHFKVALKTEIALLIENILMKTLRSKNSSIDQKCAVLNELISWFDFPQNLIELFLNYDNDQSGMPNLIRSIVSCVSSLSTSSSSNYIGVSPISPPVTKVVDGDMNGGVGEEGECLIRLQTDAQKCLVTILKTVMNASATAHSYMTTTSSSSFVPSSSPSAPYNGWIDDQQTNKMLNRIPVASTDQSSPSALKTPNPNLNRRSSVRERLENRNSDNAIIDEALAIIAKKESVRKGLQFLIDKGCMTFSPREMSMFLKLHQEGIDEKVMGDFIGEDGESGGFGSMFMDTLRDEFIGGICYAGFTFDYSCRYILTKCGFRLPGEAQKIYKILESFGRCYMRDNVTSEFNFKNNDATFLLAYSIIMLNTDLHNPNIRAAEKMTKDKFIANNRGNNGGDNFPSDELNAVFDSIKENPIQIPVNGKIITNDSSFVANDKVKLFAEEMDISTMQAVAFLNLQSLCYRPFYFKMSEDLVRLLFEEIWWDVHKCIESIIKLQGTEKNMILTVLTILRYTLGVCLFLDMKVERQAFAELLARIYYEIERSISSGVEYSKSVLKTDRMIFLSGKHLKVEWFELIIKAERDKDIETVVPILHDVVQNMQAKIQHEKEYMQLVEMQRSFDSSSFNFVDPHRKLIKQGELTKIDRKGKPQKYTFFLFSDMLVYANKIMITRKYKIHQNFPLRNLRISENSPIDRRSFVIDAQEKVFKVVAPSDDLKTEWMREIDLSIRDLKNNSNLNVISTSPTKMLETEESDERLHFSSSSSFNNHKLVFTETELTALGISIVDEDIFTIALKSCFVLLNDDKRDREVMKKKLFLYALMKQSLYEDQSLPPPSDPIALSQWLVYEKLKGMESKVAMTHFVAFVNLITI